MCLVANKNAEHIKLLEEELHNKISQIEKENTKNFEKLKSEQVLNVSNLSLRLTSELGNVET